MKIWILVGLAVILLVWSLTREGFEARGRRPPPARPAQAPRKSNYVNPPGAPPPVCPMGTILNAAGNCVSERTTPFRCPNGFLPRGDKCRRLAGTGTAPPMCPAGMNFSRALNGCEGKPVLPTCPSGYEFRNKMCKLRPRPGGASGRGAPPAASDRRQQVFGPLMPGRARTGTQSAGDSSKTNVYPQLLGGMPMAPPRRSVLPTTTSLGLDGGAKFFPQSRQPGDMDIIPDPYRVSSTFSQASYSSKTEPTPFLTDFSAFLK